MADETEEDISPEWLDEYEGQLALDLYQTADDLVVKAPIAGVKPDRIDVSITDDVITIKGERQDEDRAEDSEYVVQECFWGSFSRSITLPVPVQSEKAKANLKDGVLTIVVPKDERTRTKVLKIETD